MCYWIEEERKVGKLNKQLIDVMLSVLALSKRIELNWRIFVSLTLSRSRWKFLANTLCDWFGFFLVPRCACFFYLNWQFVWPRQTLAHHIALPHSDANAHTHEYPVCEFFGTKNVLIAWVGNPTKKGYPISPHIIISFHQCVVFVVAVVVVFVFISILPNFPSIIHHTFISAAM